MKFLAIIIVVLLLCFGGLYLVARHDVVTKAQAKYSEFGAPSATFTMVVSISSSSALR